MSFVLISIVRWVLCDKQVLLAGYVSKLLQDAFCVDKISKYC